MREQLAALVRWLQSGLMRRVPLGPGGVARIRPRQIYILPTRTGLVFGAVVMVMLLGSLNYQNNLGLLFTFFLAAIGLLAMHHAWLNLLGLRIQVRAGPPVFVGETATFDVTLGTDGWRARYGIQAATRQGTSAALAIPAHDQRTLTLGVPAYRRGLLALAEVRIETQYPMQLFRAWSYVRTDAAALIYPAPARQAPEPLPDAGDARRPLRQRSEGTEDYIGTRGYRHGDSPRRIDWKALARERGLVVKEYAGEQGQDVWIDWQRLPVGDVETRLSQLTRQVLDVSAARIRFGLRLPGVVEGLSQGPVHTQRCLTRLALFDHGQADSRQRAA